MEQDDPNRSATEHGQSAGSEALDWTKPLSDPTLEKVRSQMVQQHNAKLQEAAQSRQALDEERARMRQEIEDEILEQLDDRGLLEGLEEGGKPKEEAKPDAELTEAEELRKELKEVRQQYGTLANALQQETVKREMDRLRGEILRAMSKRPEIFPPEDTEDEKEQSLLTDCIDEIARNYAVSGDARARKPVGSAVNRVADKIAYIRTRGKTVKKDTTEPGGSTRSRPEGGGGSANLPDDIKDMGIDNPEFVNRLVKHLGEKSED